MKKFYVAKTGRHPGVHKLSIPKAPKVKLIGKTLGPIKMPKMKLPMYGC